MSDLPNLQDNNTDGPKAPFWMATFSDMAILLLTFFVMIVAMSEVEVKKFKEALSYFQGHSGILQNQAAARIRQQKSEFSTREQAQRYEALLEYIQRDNLGDKVQVDLTVQGLHVVITDSVMFNSGEARLIEPSRTILKLLADVIDGQIASVMVEGHTDNQPISTFRFPSNWELSAARAASVVRFLLSLDSALPSERYAAVGFGEFRPVDTNTTPGGRAHNRRVEIFFSWEPWQNQTEPNLHRLLMLKP